MLQTVINKILKLARNSQQIHPFHPSNDQTETKPKYISLVSTKPRSTKKPFRVYLYNVWEGVAVSSHFLAVHVPKGEQTVNWAGESPNYIPFQIRNQSQHLRWSSERPTGNNIAGQWGGEGEGGVGRSGWWFQWKGTVRRGFGRRCGGGVPASPPDRPSFYWP